MTSSLVVMVAVEALGGDSLTFLVTVINWLIIYRCRVQREGAITNLAIGLPLEIPITIAFT